MSDPLKHILIYGDSLSWGIVPGTRQRLAYHKRWPGVMEGILNRERPIVRVIENCVNGRRTVWDDPFKQGRNGLQTISLCMEMNSPLSLVILMLGTNDFQSMHQNNAWLSAQGIVTLINAIRQAPIEPGMPIPPILIVSPPPVGPPTGVIGPKFTFARERSVGLAEEIRKAAEQMSCAYLDGGQHARVSQLDGVHLDEDQHLPLGKAVAEKVASLLNI